MSEQDQRVKHLEEENARLRTIILSSGEAVKAWRIDELEQHCKELKTELERARASAKVADELRAELEKERVRSGNLGATVDRLRRVIDAGCDAMHSLSSYSSNMAEAFGHASVTDNVGKTAMDVAEACEAIGKAVGK